MPKPPALVAPPEPHASEHGAKPQPNPPPAPADEAAASAGGVALRIITTTVLLALVLLPVRAKTAGFWFSSIVTDWDNQLLAALMSACYDVLFLAGGAAFFALALLPPLRRILPPKLVWRVYLGFALLTLVASLANLGAVPWLGQPFNYQWLYYSDFFRGPDALASVLAAVSVWMMLCGLAAGVAFIFLSARAARWIEARIETPRARASALILAASVASVYLGASFHSRVPKDWGYDVLANPVWAFGESWVLATRAPEPFTLATPYGADDFEGVTTNLSLLPPERHVPRNVVIVVLESVSAQYVGLYGAKHGVTPELDRQRSRAATFVNAYAHAPGSNLTLVSLLTGHYPRVSFRPTTAEAPGIGLPRLPELLKGHGFATSFFSSAELDFLGANRFLAAAGDFDYIEDDELRPEAAEQARRRWPDMDGTDDRSTVESMIRWIDAHRAQPFFTVLWTAQTHFPYYVEGEPRPLTDFSPDFNRYLNALEQGDRALGRLLAWLDENDLADDTLVIVLGDHGEAFGQHKNYGHAGNVFEENVRIPLVLINPRLFSGETYSTPCGMSDVAPTIADVLRVADAPRWQGRSLFSTERPARVYFFAALSGFLLGYREGDTKFVYNTTKNKFFVHDLAGDPDERLNVAATVPELTREATLRIAAWVQHVEQSYSEASSNGALVQARATRAARRLATLDDPLLPPPMP